MLCEVGYVCQCLFFDTDRQKTKKKVAKIISYDDLSKKHECRHEKARI